MTQPDTNTSTLTATEILERRDKQNAELAAMLDDPINRIGVLLGVQSIIDKMWAADAARFKRLHGEE